jgi:uncharacterized protein (TIGR02466 family)
MTRKHVLYDEAPDVLRMFPSCVWKVDLKPDAHQILDEYIVTALELIRRNEPALAPGHGWQSDQALHKLDEFHDMASCIKDTVDSVLDQLKVSYRAFDITALWANISMPGAEHRMHCHPNNFLSGVYFIATHGGPIPLTSTIPGRRLE